MNIVAWHVLSGTGTTIIGGITELTSILDGNVLDVPDIITTMTCAEIEMTILEEEDSTGTLQSEDQTGGLSGGN